MRTSLGRTFSRSCARVHAQSHCLLSRRLLVSRAKSSQKRGSRSICSPFASRYAILVPCRARGPRGLKRNACTRPSPLSPHSLTRSLIRSPLHGSPGCNPSDDAAGDALLFQWVPHPYLVQRILLSRERERERAGEGEGEGQRTRERGQTAFREPDETECVLGDQSKGILR